MVFLLGCVLEVVDRRASATILGVRRLGGYVGWSGVGQEGMSDMAGSMLQTDFRPTFEGTDKREGESHKQRTWNYMLEPSAQCFG
jgi:hypothetical protein